MIIELAEPNYVSTRGSVRRQLPPLPGASYPRLPRGFQCLVVHNHSTPLSPQARFEVLAYCEGDLAVQLGWLETTDLSQVRDDLRRHFGPTVAGEAIIPQF